MINLSLAGRKVLMLAPCLGKFGGIETFCLTLCEDILKKGGTIRLMRKMVSGFPPMALSKGTKQKFHLLGLRANRKLY